MSAKQNFIDFFDKMYENYSEQMPEDVMKYYEAFKAKPTEKEKEPFTENGKLILQHLQEHNEGYVTAKEIAKNMELTARTVVGAIRKLVQDGYVDKQEADTPKGVATYVITETGLNVNFN